MPMESGLCSTRDGEPRVSLLSLRIYISALVSCLIGARLLVKDRSG